MRNVVLICLDSVRKDIYEEEMTKTKELVDLSLEDCRAASSWSVPSHASFLTGQLPHEHGVHTHSLDFSLLDESEVFTSRMQFANSCSISANQFTTSQFGFDNWFDECSTIGSTSYYPMGLEVWKTDGVFNHLVQSLKHDHPIKSVANGAVSASIKLSDQLPIRSPFDDGAETILKVAEQSISETESPYFFFINLMEAHHPHRLIRKYRNASGVPTNWSSAELDLMELNKGSPDFVQENGDYVQNFRTLYGEAVNYLDYQVSEFIRSLQQDTMEEVTFIITSDHGENLGYEADDFLFGHTASLSEGLLHVPFDIVNPPKIADIDSGQIFSQKRLRDIIESIAHEEVISIPQHQYVAAELIGSGPMDDPDEYWDRMIRCVYDLNSQVKVTWDSMGNSYRDDLSDSANSDRTARESIETVPEWATEQFEVEISEYKDLAMTGKKSKMGSLNAGTRDRLEELGYL